PDWFTTIFHSGISSAAVMAVVLNLLFNHLRAGTPAQPSVLAARGARYVSPVVLEALEEGDYVRDGKLVDASGAEVPILTGAVARPEERRHGPAGRQRDERGGGRCAAARGSAARSPCSPPAARTPVAGSSSRGTGWWSCCPPVLSRPRRATRSSTR